MNSHWNWAEFFKQAVHPPFTIDANIEEGCHKLLNLSFSQGLSVIVSSVPAFAQQQWLRFHNHLRDCGDQHAYSSYWLLISRLIREHLRDVERLLHLSVEQAVTIAQHRLLTLSKEEQFALMTCLHHYTHNSLQERMMFGYLLEHCDPYSQQVHDTLVFFRSLTDRQKEVASLAADGLTNLEIAHELGIEQAVVAEHLTDIFNRFQRILPYVPDKHGTRYRLIHWLTRLFIEHPLLRVE